MGKIGVTASNDLQLGQFPHTIQNMGSVSVATVQAEASSITAQQLDSYITINEREGGLGAQVNSGNINGNPLFRCKVSAREDSLDWEPTHAALLEALVASSEIGVQSVAIMMGDVVDIDNVFWAERNRQVMVNAVFGALLACFAEQSARNIDNILISTADRSMFSTLERTSDVIAKSADQITPEQRKVVDAISERLLQRFIDDDHIARDIRGRLSGSNYRVEQLRVAKESADLSDRIGELELTGDRLERAMSIKEAFGSEDEDISHRSRMIGDIEVELQTLSSVRVFRRKKLERERAALARALSMKRTDRRNEERDQLSSIVDEELEHVNRTIVQIGEQLNQRERILKGRFKASRPLIDSFLVSRRSEVNFYNGLLSIYRPLKDALESGRVHIQAAQEADRYRRELNHVKTYTDDVRAEIEAHMNKAIARAQDLADRFYQALHAVPAVPSIAASDDLTIDISSNRGFDWSDEFSMSGLDGMNVADVARIVTNLVVESRAKIQEIEHAMYEMIRPLIAMDQDEDTVHQQQAYEAA